MSDYRWVEESIGGRMKTRSNEQRIMGGVFHRDDRKYSNRVQERWRRGRRKITYDNIHPKFFDLYFSTLPPSLSHVTVKLEAVARGCQGSVQFFFTCCSAQHFFSFSLSAKSLITRGFGEG